MNRGRSRGEVFHWGPEELHAEIRKKSSENGSGRKQNKCSDITPLRRNEEGVQ